VNHGKLADHTHRLASSPSHCLGCAPRLGPGIIDRGGPRSETEMSGPSVPWARWLRDGLQRLRGNHLLRGLYPIQPSHDPRRNSESPVKVGFSLGLVHTHLASSRDSPSSHSPQPFIISYLSAGISLFEFHGHREADCGEGWCRYSCPRAPWRLGKGRSTSREEAMLLQGPRP
jgi:hypothetical protein